MIKKSGTYGITFNVNLAGSGQTTPAVFEIYANARLIASVTVYPFATLAKVAKIVCLEKNEVLQVKAATTITLYDANLTAARLDSHKHESSSSSSFKCKHESSSSSSTCKKECRKCHEVLGYASFSATSGRLFDPDEFIPLNNEVIAECTDISPIGGLAIKKSGTYGITFNANLQSGTNATFEIFANARLIASVTVLPNTTLAKVGKIVCLEENEVLQVKNATATQINLFDANLTAAKLDD
ncbi:hypothetical protein M1K46_13675 [Fictibacillus sp. WQ 8-8]|uniref:hypothetical protein n=1 Tax=Fictibacillus sp. WQ 8-8 TaxID=2938788 RepID=UPI00210C88B1|nr:hypothetical protein [Fictibacillus sp. WQ 8-8]MCQ6266706.1 hypothetical protein [Fictibacillus sp. WQ 8-8]